MSRSSTLPRLNRTPSPPAGARGPGFWLCQKRVSKLRWREGRSPSQELDGGAKPLPPYPGSRPKSSCSPAPGLNWKYCVITRCPRYPCSRSFLYTRCARSICLIHFRFILLLIFGNRVRSMRAKNRSPYLSTSALCSIYHRIFLPKSLSSSLE